MKENEVLLCQHRNQQDKCPIICGTSRECAHSCCEHEPHTPDGIDLDEYDIRRECLNKDCHCGKYSELATELEAQQYGKMFGESQVSFFLDPENLGEKFNWDRMERHIMSLASIYWHLSARYGYEEVVSDAAVLAWRVMKPKDR